MDIVPEECIGTNIFAAYDVSIGQGKILLKRRCDAWDIRILAGGYPVSHRVRRGGPIVGPPCRILDKVDAR